MMQLDGKDIRKRNVCSIDFLCNFRIYDFEKKQSVMIESLLKMEKICFQLRKKDFELLIFINSILFCFVVTLQMCVA